MSKSPDMITMLLKDWERQLIKDAEDADWDIKKFRYFISTNVKPINKGGRPKGRKPSTVKRNKEIQLAYAKLLKKGYTAKASKEKLSKKHELAVSTIDTILKRG